MKVIKWVFVVLIFVVFLVSHVQAQELIVYPAKGQGSEQMEKDKYECYSWAKGQTGFDPMQVPTTSSPPPAEDDKSVAGSAVGGGVVGGLGGALLGGVLGGRKGAKKGLAIGGLSGGAIGGMRSSSQNKQARKERKQWEQQQANQYMQQRNTYNRAYGACLEGKGYTVK